MNKITDKTPWMKTKHFQSLLNKCKACTDCSLHTKRTGDPVIYRGNRKSKIMWVGLGPGKNEEATGIPFIGKAGQLAAKCFKWIGHDINSIYISNVTKCRNTAPKGSGKENLTPSNKNVKICADKFLRHEIEEIDPKLIIAVGRAASIGLKLGVPPGPVTPHFNKFFDCKLVPDKTYPALFIRHPASLLYPKPESEKQKIREEYFRTWDIIKSHMDKIKRRKNVEC